MKSGNHESGTRIRAVSYDVVRIVRGAVEMSGHVKTDWQNKTMLFDPAKRKIKRQPIACDHKGTVKTYTVHGGYKCSRCGRNVSDE